MNNLFSRECFLASPLSSNLINDRARVASAYFVKVFICGKVALYNLLVPDTRVSICS